MTGRQLHWRGRHAAIWIWPSQSVNIPLGRHRILLIARGTLDRKSVFHRWRIQIEVMQLHFCCGRGGDGHVPGSIAP